MSRLRGHELMGEPNVPTIDVAAISEPVFERLGEKCTHLSGAREHVADPPGLSRLLPLDGERRGEDAEGEDSCERSAYDRHAATPVCWLSTAAIFRQPSIRRNLICPLATRLKSRTRAASSLGSELWVFTRRRNSSWSRSIAFVVRNVFHCALGKRKNVRSSSPPSCRLVTTPGHRLPHVRSKAAYATPAA